MRLKLRTISLRQTSRLCAVAVAAQLCLVLATFAGSPPWSGMAQQPLGARLTLIGSISVGLVQLCAWIAFYLSVFFDDGGSPKRLSPSRAAGFMAVVMAAELLVQALSLRLLNPHLHTLPMSWRLVGPLLWNYAYGILWIVFLALFALDRPSRETRRAALALLALLAFGFVRGLWGVVQMERFAWSSFALNSWSAVVDFLLRLAVSLFARAAAVLFVYAVWRGSGASEIVAPLAEGESAHEPI